jgi:hypothetical protein
MRGTKSCLPDDERSGDGVLVGTTGSMGTGLLRIQKSETSPHANLPFRLKAPFFGPSCQHYYAVDYLRAMKAQNLRLVEISGYRGIPLRLALLPAVLALFLLNFRAAGVTGSVRAYPYGEPNTTRTVSWTPGTELGDWLLASSPFSTASANYHIDLAAGMVGACAEFQHSADSPYGGA